MAPPGDRLLWKDPIIREKEKEPYNGYITTTVQALDKPQYGSWTFFNGKLRVGPIESGSGFILLCVLWLIFASIPETVMHVLCALTQRIIIVLLPVMCLVCVFFWVELLVQKYCEMEVSFSVFPICVVGEVCTQSLLDASDFLRTTSLFSVLLVASGAVIFSKFKLVPCSLVLLLMWISRISCWLTLQPVPASLRPYLAYISAFSGVVLSRHIQECVAQTPTEIECKTPMIRRRRTSSVSSSSSLNSRARRTSLPALGLQTKGSVDNTTLGEAHGMITDLLADSNTPPNVASTLKIISTMIAPTTAFHTAQRPFVAQMSPLIERFRDEHQEEKVRDQPDLKDDIHLPMMGRLRRSVGSPARRMSSTWTTTTSATGMPTLDVDMQLTRAHELSTCNANSSPSGTPRSTSPLALGSKTKLETSDNSPVKPVTQEFSSKHRPSLFAGTFPPASGSPNLMRKSPDRQQPPSPVLQKSPDKMIGCFNRMLNDEDVKVDKKRVEKTSSNNSDHEDNSSSEQCNCTCHSIGNSSVNNRNPRLGSDNEKNADKDFELPKNEELDKILHLITDWNFPIFDACKYGNILCQVSFKVFQNVGLFEAFRIPEKSFLRFFHTLESGYHDIPYHNCIHAADVLHGVYYLTTQNIPGFCLPGPSQKIGNGSDSDSDSGITTCHSGCRKSCSGYGTLMDAIPLLELLALYTAAAMHDYDHPGRTNAFLVATLSEQALLYNDRSVLENHHAASSFSLLLSDPDFKFLCELEPAQFKRFRFLVIECILATDLKRHFDILSEFNAKMSEDGGGLDWSLEADRLLTVQICIKMADISGPSKRRDLHVTWTERIVEEFYEQGDEEIERGMPVSPYMDRNQPHVEQLQESFINHLVAPLFNSYANAGLMPGKWVEMSDSSSEIESGAEISDEDSKDRELEKQNVEKKRPKRRKIVSELTTNIETNFEYWLKKLKQFQRDKKLAENSNADEDLEQEVLRETPITEDILEEDENGSENSNTVSESPLNSRVTEV